MDINSDITNIPLIGPAKATLLDRLGIHTVKDLLFTIPFKYRDTSNVISISKLKELKEGTIIAKVEKIENVFTRFRKVFTRAKVVDDSGSINIVWFNQSYLVKSIHVGEVYIFEGKISKKNNDLIAPSYEIFSGSTDEQTHIGKITPYYSETEGISSKWLRSRIGWIKKNYDNLEIPDIDKDILDGLNLISLKDALHKVHFPSNFQDISAGRERLAFDEMLGVAIEIENKSKIQKSKSANSIEVNKEDIDNFISKLPYKLTHDQLSAINDIQNDIQSELPMNRLLNGDVGSGKTVVVACAIYLAYKSGFSSILLAPTTILASQHYKTLTNILKPFGINVEIVEAGVDFKFKKKPQVIISTHAILYRKEEIHNLGLLIVDEQHRFGVKQREQLSNDRTDMVHPHYIMLSATPIPHTLTHIIFGDMDASYIRELPPQRIPISSYYVPFEKRENCLKWVADHIKQSNLNEQAFIIFPIIEESETLDLKSAIKEHDELSKSIFKDLKVGLLHGRMKNSEKEKILNDFRAKKFNILISTTVVEVGIDIPDATIMVVEDAQRFGLAQLHQLRGRVGRSNLKSYCYVISSKEIEESGVDRLKYFASHPSGFDVAQYDLQKRGPGEVYGTKQSGIPNFKVASINDIELLIKSRSIVHKLGDTKNLKDILFK